MEGKEKVYVKEPIVIDERLFANPNGWVVGSLSEPTDKEAGREEGSVLLELSPQQYADVREAVGYLGKLMAFNPSIEEDAVMTREELGSLASELERQCSWEELVRMLLASGREGR